MLAQVFLKEEGATQKELDQYLDGLCKIAADRQELVDAQKKKEIDIRDSKNASKRTDAHVNVSMKSRLMDLRKCTNHPYLLEYPLTDDGLYYKYVHLKYGQLFHI